MIGGHSSLITITHTDTLALAQVLILGGWSSTRVCVLAWPRDAFASDTRSAPY